MQNIWGDIREFRGGYGGGLLEKAPDITDYHTGFLEKALDITDYHTMLLGNARI